jgi:hypothetical protein
MPGVIDAHVHINEPGRTEWEGFETATLAAAAGGSDDHYRHAAQRESGYNARGFIEKLEASKVK